MMDSQIFELNSFLFYTLIALTALAVGSLLNVIIYRLPLMLKSEFINECRCLLNLEAPPDNNLNLFFPRSFCPSCKKTIKAIHNIPVLSYLLLRGRCRYCSHPISRRYPLVEALSCLLAIFATWHFGFNLTLLFALLLIWILIALTFIDLDHQLLPDNLTLSLLWLGLFANTQSLFVPLQEAIFSAAGAYLVLWLFIRIYYLITGKIGMGNGDFKLFAAFGAWFGWTQLPLILLMASLTGAISGMAYLKIKHKSQDTPISFGPFLCIVGFISLFWGQSLMKWYLSLWY
ncbi:MAG: prepilin peptidase [Legionella sp.]|nr:prepilin peptidase [Legionella sp.]